MKRLFTFILTLTMAFSFCVNSFAAAATTTTATETTAATAATTEASADTSSTQTTGASYGTSKLSGAPDIVAESAVVMDAGYRNGSLWKRSQHKKISGQHHESHDCFTRR